MKNAFRFKRKMNRKSLSLSVIGDAHRSFWLKLGHLTDSVFRLSTILLGLRQDSKRTVAFIPWQRSFLFAIDLLSGYSEMYAHL